MKIIITILCSTLMLMVQAQEKITRSYPVKSGQQLELSFDYPNIIKLSTWSGNEVLVEATVEINGGEHNDAFVLESKEEGNTLVISNRIKDMDKLPRRYTIGVGKEKIVFSNKQAMEEYMAKMKRGNYYTNSGVDLQITIEVKVPVAMAQTYARAKYGLLELIDFNGKIRAEANYGGIDATINEPQTGKVQAETHYGKIYSNLDLAITDSQERDFFTALTMSKGKGNEYSLKSIYGKIYLRKTAK